MNASRPPATSSQNGPGPDADGHVSRQSGPDPSRRPRRRSASARRPGRPSSTPRAWPAARTPNSRAAADTISAAVSASSTRQVQTPCAEARDRRARSAVIVRTREARPGRYDVGDRVIARRPPRRAGQQEAGTRQQLPGDPRRPPPEASPGSSRPSPPFDADGDPGPGRTTRPGWRSPHTRHRAGAARAHRLPSTAHAPGRPRPRRHRGRAAGRGRAARDAAQPPRPGRGAPRPTRTPVTAALAIVITSAWPRRSGLTRRRIAAGGHVAHVALAQRAPARHSATMAYARSARRLVVEHPVHRRGVRHGRRPTRP